VGTICLPLWPPSLNLRSQGEREALRWPPSIAKVRRHRWKPFDHERQPKSLRPLDGLIAATDLPSESAPAAGATDEAAAEGAAAKAKLAFVPDEPD